MKIRSFHDLEVWHKAIDMVDIIYEITEAFPKSETFGLASQMRRCAVSVPSNIAEGSRRSGTKELIQHLFIARGSLAELETQLIIARRRNYCSEPLFNKALEHIRRVGQMSARLIQSLRK